MPYAFKLLMQELMAMNIAARLELLDKESNTIESSIPSKSTPCCQCIFTDAVAEAEQHQ